MAGGAIIAPWEILLRPSTSKKSAQVPQILGSCACALTLRLLYAHRWQPVTICAELVPCLRPHAWRAHVGTARSMLSALLAKRKPLDAN